ncbi:probable 39S ribosomal protein L24, mitochondrial [Vespa mandarinia]|uniref:probable 39S ribosomal protein L24, mitochondrial n=1 Tax=Vespa mandarinia TaxID=7446 RepID=UPI00160F6C27|nr:probable 39S ribosomal protein L24, mitochondrial [Vespa mandarinia]XP_035730414.1 probable 39S ribosomal protein L24, mitochondrial [Vespa mandarinia]
MRLTNYLFKRVAEWTKKYSNLPDSYIDRTMRQVYWRTPRGKPQYLPRTLERKRYWFSIYKPWTNNFKIENIKPLLPDYIHIEPIKDWSFFRGDRVEILIGKDKGKQGIVRDIIQERNWVFVEGLNTKLECIGKTKTFPGIYISMEQPLLVTRDILLVDPHDLNGTQIEWRYTDEGNKVRVSVRTGRIIPMPESALETIDYKHPKLYKEQSKDTTKEEVTKVTFKPVLKTFEMDIMDNMGIKEDRTSKKSYWY